MRMRKTIYLVIALSGLMAAACTPDETIFSTEANHSKAKADETTPGDDQGGGSGDDTPIDYQGVDPRFFEVLNLSYPGLEAVKAQYEEKDITGAVEAMREYYRTRPVVNPDIDLSDRTVTNSARSIADQAKEYRFYTMSYNEGTNADGTTLYWSQKNADGSINWTTAPSGVLDKDEYIKQIHRFMWMPYQARAYYATGDESYVKSIIEVWDDYLEKFPIPEGRATGTPWTSLQMSQKLLGWMSVLPMILTSENVTPQWLAKMVVFVHDALQSLRRSWYSPSTSNHYFAQVQALTECSIFFPEYVLHDEWFGEATGLVTSQLSDQFNEDGVQNELDVSYHLGVVSNFETIQAFALANGCLGSFPSDYSSLLRNSCRFVMDFMYPDYSFESFNDTRGARQSKNVLLRNLQSYYEMFPDDEELHWMASARTAGREPASLVQKYPSSGYYMMRSSWAENALMLILKNNYNPQNAWHCQPDNGTVAVYKNGRKFLPDAGVFTYSTGSVRNKYASTAMHNTVTKNDVTISNGHMLGRLLAHQSKADYEVVVTENPSYDDLTHRRAVYMVDKAFFVVVDEAYGKAEAPVNIYWHLCADTAAGGLGSDVVVTDGPGTDGYGMHTVFADNNNMMFRTFAETVGERKVKEGISNASNEIDNSYERRYYGVQIAKPADKAARFITVIYPFGSPSEAASVVLSASFEGEAGAFSEGGSTVKVTVNGKEYTLGYSI